MICRCVHWSPEPMATSASTSCRRCLPAATKCARACARWPSWRSAADARWLATHPVAAARAHVPALRALPGVEVVGADLGQPAQLRAAMDGIDTLFHVAAVFATTDPSRDAEVLRTAIEGTEASLRAARDAKVRRVVMTSSMVTLPFTAPGCRAASSARGSAATRRRSTSCRRP